jgi:hypothetical protein
MNSITNAVFPSIALTWLLYVFEWDCVVIIITNMIHRQHIIESSYTCEECAESFGSREELYDHIHQMHGI